MINQYPRKPVTAFQAPPIDRLHGLGDHDSQIAVTPGTGALEVFQLPRAARHSSNTIRATSSPNHSANSFMLTANR